MKRNHLVFLLSILTFNLFCQVHWTKHPDNPIMTGASGEWDNIVEPGTVLYYNDTYHLYYCGGGSLPPTGVGYATSPDGITWTRYANNPIVVVGSEGEWDRYSIQDCHVVKLDTIFHMWYTGDDSSSEIYRIGHATSPDGLTWTKDPGNPIEEIIEGNPESTFSFESPVVYDGNLFHLYYSTGIWSGLMKMNHAMSEDGYKWTLDPDNPIMQANDNKDFRTPEAVVYTGNQYIMSYLSGNTLEWVFNIAISEDLYSWEEYDNNPTFTPGPAGSWDATVGRATIIYDSIESKYKMWYLGGNSPTTLCIGYAESSPFVTIPDTAFLYALIREGVDTDEDSLISYAEAEAVNSLNVGMCPGPMCPNKISSMVGIEAFVNLDTLICNENKFSSLDVSSNTALKYLECDNYWNLETVLTTLNVSNNTALTHLNCEYNQLTSLDVSSNTELTNLNCRYNSLTSLDVSNNTALTELFCGDNLLTSLDISNNNSIETLRISDMPSLHEVCVWEMPFPPSGVNVVTTKSPNVEFKDCSSTTGIDKSSQSELSIYPNPTNSLLTIEAENPNHYSINITTLNGQQILTGEMEGTSHKIDLSSFPKGVYFITLRSKDFLNTEKIIKF